MLDQRCLAIAVKAYSDRHKRGLWKRCEYKSYSVQGGKFISAILTWEYDKEVGG